MKKMLSLFLCVLMVMSVFSGCGAQQPAESTGETTLPQPEHVLKVGYGRVDITPTENVPLGGHLTLFMSENVREHLFATCIAMTDETDNTILIFCLDLLYAYGSALYAKRAVSQATGVPANQIMITTNHNHSGPDLNNATPAIEKYTDSLKQWMADAAVAAMADRKPVTETATGARNVKNLNFVRHYVMADGTIAGDNFGNKTNNPYVKHVTDVDDQLQVIRFRREGGKDVVMANFQGHPTGHGTYKYSIMSHVDVFRRYVETEMDCHFAYILGASGNVNSSTKLKEESIASDYIEHGTLLGKQIEALSAELTPVKTAKLQLVMEQYKATPKDGGVDTQMPIYAFAFGDVGVITAPYEMFCENGRAIKEKSPFPTTFVASCSNGSFSYIPSIATFEYGGYEVGMTKFKAGTAEELETAFVGMLNQMWNEQK